MTKSTKLIIADGIYIITDIGHRRTSSTDQSLDIERRRLAEEVDRPTSVSAGTAVLELSEPQLVRRVRAHRDSAGNIHLELEE
jgi:hypothetical protein